MNEPIQTNALVQHETQALQEMTVQDVVQQITKIQQLMKVALKEGEHYGTIPGTGDKKTLLKSGAEKLCLMFRMAPSFDVKVTEYPEGHREYQVVCRMTHINSGNLLGEGLGSCSTLENKYRYRWENTGQPVPNEYWESRDPELLGGTQFSTRKIKGRWLIFQKIPHDNPADYYNTALKMAKKRAQVDACLTTTAASDIFTQDVEDLPVEAPPEPVKAKSKPAPDPIQQEMASRAEEAERSQEVQENPESDSPNETPTNVITDKQRKRFFAIAKKNQWTEIEMKMLLSRELNIDSSSAIPWDEYDDIIKIVEKRPKDYFEGIQ